MFIVGSRYPGNSTSVLIGCASALTRDFAVMNRRILSSCVFSISVSVVVLLAYAVMLRGIGDHEVEGVVIAGVFAASVLSSVGGFAFSAICGALLFHVSNDPVHVVRVMLLCSIVNQAFMVWSLRRDLARRALVPFVVGGVLGLPCGLFLLLHADRSFYTDIIGGLILAYGAYMLARRPLKAQQHRPVWDVAVGFLGGVTGGAAAFPGGPVTIWGSLKGWDKARQRALYQPFILIMQLLAVAMLAAMRPADTAPFYFSALLYVPAALLGARCGMGIFAKLGERQFAVALSLLLIASGLGLLI